MKIFLKKSKGNYRQIVLNEKNAANVKSGSLLAKKLFDDKGNYMSPTRSGNFRNLYSYYVSQAQIQSRKQDIGSISKVSAIEIESLVKNEIIALMQNKEVVQGYFEDYPVRKQNELIKAVGNTDFNDSFIKVVLYKVTIHKNKVDILLCKDTLKKAIEAEAYKTDLPIMPEFPDDFVCINKKIKISSTGNNGAKMIIGGTESQPHYNLQLIKAVVQSFYYQKLLEENELTPEMKNNSYIKRVMNLRFLDPKLIEDILNGNQQRDLSVLKLFKLAAT
jgi:hypothetical protein